MAWMHRKDPADRYPGQCRPAGPGHRYGGRLWAPACGPRASRLVLPICGGASAAGAGAAGPPLW